MCIIGRDFTRFGLHDDMQPGQHGFAKLGVKDGHFTIEGLGEDLVDPFAEVCRIIVTRHINEAGNEPLEIVLTQEQGDPLAFLKLQDTHRGFK